jgi:hypothetical protein
MEVGINIAKGAVKGGRSYVRIFTDKTDTILIQLSVLSVYIKPLKEHSIKGFIHS